MRNLILLPNFFWAGCKIRDLKQCEEASSYTCTVPVGGQWWTIREFDSLHHGNSQYLWLSCHGSFQCEMAWSLPLLGTPIGAARTSQSEVQLLHHLEVPMCVYEGGKDRERGNGVGWWWYEGVGRDYVCDGLRVRKDEWWAINNATLFLYWFGWLTELTSW